MKNSPFRFVAVLLLLLAFAAPARALDVTVASFTINGWQYSGTTFYLRIAADSSFVTLAGETVPQGTLGTSAQDVYRTVTCTANTSTKVLTCPTFTLPSTTDAQVNPQATWSGAVYSSTGAKLKTLFSGYFLSASLAANTSLAEWTVNAQSGGLANPPRTYYTASEVDTQIRNQVNVGNPAKAYTEPTPLGRIATDVAPADAALPVAVGTNSPRVPSQQLVYYLDRYASLSAALTAIGATEATLVVGTSVSAAGVSIPSNVTVQFVSAGQFTGSGTVTMAGPLSAPARQVFASTLALSLSGSSRVTYILPQWWGAKCDGATNDHTAFVSASAARNTAGNRLDIPESSAGCLVGGASATNQVISMTTPGTIAGRGPRSVLLLHSATGVTVDTLRITPPAHVGSQEALLNTPEGNAGYVLENFAIRPQSGTPGRDGIRVDITTPGSFFQNAHIRGLQIGDLGGHSLSLLNTGCVNTDGIFNLFVYDNIFHGGIFADCLGDSNHFLRNRFWSSVDATHRAFDVTFITGAGATEVIGNNITMKLGAKFGGGTGTIFADNYCEPFRPGSLGADGACVSFDGGAINPKIVRNTINGALGGNTLDGIYLGNVVGATVDDNAITVGVGDYGVVVSASASNVNVGHLNTVPVGVTLMNDLGSGTTTSVFSASGGRVTRLGTAFGTALGLTEIYTGFGASNPAALQIDQNTTTSTDANFAALVLSTKQTGTANIVGGVYFANPSLGATEKRLGAFTVSTAGATNTGQFDFATSNAGTYGVRFSITPTGVKIGSGGSDMKDARSASASLNYAQALADSCETLPVPLTGVADDGAWALGFNVPHALVNHNTTATFTAWVSATNEVSVRRCVISADGSDPAAASVRVMATKF
jgi:hypothetical protein